MCVCVCVFIYLFKSQGGNGPDLREGALRAVRETGEADLRLALMEIEARLCMAEQVARLGLGFRVYISGQGLEIEARLCTAEQIARLGVSVCVRVTVRVRG